MMRGLRSTLVLLVVFLGLAAYVYFVESKRTPSSESGQTKEKAFSVAADAIKELRVRSSSGEVTDLQKTDTTWHVVAPMKADADQPEVSGLTTSLTSLEIQRVVEDNPTDLGQFGLAEPRVDVAFKADDEKDFRHLLLGDKTATGGDMYAKTSGAARVFLISAYLDSSFDRSTFNLRDKTVLKFDRDKVDMAQVTTSDHTMKLTKADNEWRMTEPWQARADYGAVEGLIGRLSTGQMKSIVTATPGDPVQYGLDAPTAAVTLGAGSSRATLIVGKAAADGSLYARDSSRDMIFTIESSLADDMKKQPEEFRRKDVFEFRLFNCTQFDLTRDGQAVTYQKVKGKDEAAPGKWQQVSPVAEVDSTKLESALSSFSSLRAASFVDTRDKLDLDHPLASVAVKYDDGKKQERVRFLRSGESVYAVRDDEPGAAVVDKTAFDNALKALDEAHQPAQPENGKAGQPANPPK